MSETVVENLSNYKLFYLMLGLAIAQLLFFLLGGLMSPEPSTSMTFLMTKCHDPSLGVDHEWFYLRPREKSNCKIIRDFDDFSPSETGNMRDIVFIAQMPHARSGVVLQYSPWFQFLLGLLDVDTEYHSPHWPLANNAHLRLEVKLGYRNHDDPQTHWHELSSTTVNRRLDCSIDNDKKHPGSTYNCSVLNLFELGSNAYPFYLLNVRIPMAQQDCSNDRNGPNCAIGKLRDLNLVEIHQNGGFTQIWLSIKTVMTPVVIASTVWYWRRIHMLVRAPKLLEKAIFALAIALSALDCIIACKLSCHLPGPKACTCSSLGMAVVVVPHSVHARRQ